MTREELGIALKKDVKTLRDISKTMELHGYYKSIPMVLNNIADDVELYMKAGEITLEGKVPAELPKDILTRNKLNTKKGGIS